MMRRMSPRGGGAVVWLHEAWCEDGGGIVHLVTNPCSAALLRAGQPFHFGASSWCPPAKGGAPWQAGAGGGGAAPDADAVLAGLLPGSSGGRRGLLRPSTSPSSSSFPREAA
jgi:hypothetical protein